MREFDSQMASLNKSYTYALLRANHLNKYTTPILSSFPPDNTSYLKGFIYIFYYTYIICIFCYTALWNS